MTADAPAASPRVAPSRARRFATWLHVHPGARLRLLLAGPMFWMVVIYLGSLAILLLNAFWTSDSFTGKVESVRLVARRLPADLRERGLPHDRDPHDRDRRAGDGHGRGPCIPDRLLHGAGGEPSAEAAAGRRRPLPLWASYLVKIFAWRTILQSNGFLTWLLTPLGISGPGTDEIANSWIVFSYLWLPYMVLPLYAGLERIPPTLLEASGDLGARRRDDVPSGRPAARLPVARRRLDLHVLADPRRLHRARPGQRREVHRQRDLRQLSARQSAGRGCLLDLPIVIVVAYLFLARRLGAFESL